MRAVFRCCGAFIFLTPKYMNSMQENKLSMAYTVLETCRKNRGKWENLPAFVQAYAGLEGVIQGIENALEVQITNTKGITINKHRVREGMVYTGLKVAGAVHAFAETINDDELKEEMRFGKSALLKSRDSYVIQKCQLIADRASANVASLGDFGVTVSIIQAFQAKIDEFSQKSPRPRMAVTDRNKATQEMGTLFTRLNKVLGGVMDKLMESYREEDPGFYAVYHGSREVVDYGIKYTNLFGVVVEAATKSPIGKAIVVIAMIREDGSVVTHTANTSRDGSFGFEKIEAGEYEVTVERAGYVRGIEKLDIRRGRSHRVEIFLTKDSGN